MTAVAKLLPCPFCGDEPTMHTWSDHGYVRIECKPCNFEWDYFHTPSDAAESWNRRAALSPAELGGVELPVGQVSDGFSGHQRAVNLYGPIRCQPAPGTMLYTTPRAAEASDAAALRLDDYLCNEHGICIGKQAAIAALAFALTPPSAKGE